MEKRMGVQEIASVRGIFEKKLKDFVFSPGFCGRAAFTEAKKRRRSMQLVHKLRGILEVVYNTWND